MVEDEVKTEVPDIEANGNNLPTKGGETLSGRKEENNGVKEMEEDREVEKMEEDTKEEKSEEGKHKEEKMEGDENVPQPLPNGNGIPRKSDDPSVGTKEEGNNGVQEVEENSEEKEKMGEDNKENEQMDEDREEEDKIGSGKMDGDVAMKEVTEGEEHLEKKKSGATSTEALKEEIDSRVEQNDEDGEDKNEIEWKVGKLKEAEEEQEHEEQEEKKDDGEGEEEKKDGNEEQDKDDGEEVEEKKDIKEEQDKDDGEEGEEEKKKETEDNKVKRRSKTSEKRRSDAKKSRRGEKKKVEQQRTPVAADRPVRERKSVERLVASVDKDSTRELHIEKGRGTPLKDIPNVAFKLSRKKTDDTFKLLHTILFGRRGKAFLVKSNISRFSGFVWHQNEEKQKTKVKEKFDKCNKEKLLEFCDVLDIPIAKANTRKEDIVARLIDFLVAPHPTTTVLLAEKEKPTRGTKRKMVTKQSSTSGSKRSVKRQRKSDSNPKRSGTDTEAESEAEKEEQEQEIEEHDDEENLIGVPEKSEDEMPQHSGSEVKNESDDESEEDVKKKDESEEDVKKKKRRTAKAHPKNKEATGDAKTKKITAPRKSITREKSSPKVLEADDDPDSNAKMTSRKRNVKGTKATEKATKEKSSTQTKSAVKSRTGKKVAKGEKVKPSDDELRDAICEILKDVDFNTATFTDILKALAKQFNIDLTPRKASIKLMIQEELTKLADEADDEEGDEDAKKDETRSAGQEVEA